MAAVVIGAGVGGLSAAIALAAKGESVRVLEKQKAAGGKMVPVMLDGESYDAGPTVLTLRWVFEELFQMAGADLGATLGLEPLGILARHAWTGDATLDLYADQSRSADAIGSFSGAADAKGFRNFCAEARRIYETLEAPFLRSQRPNPLSLTLKAGLLPIMRINPYETYWSALGKHFHDPRLRQLFGRYATYCGTSPFTAPGTMMLVAHVESMGVWRVKGGMAALASALENLARRLGVEFHFGTAARRIETVNGKVTAVVDDKDSRHPCQHVIVNADGNAVAEGLLGPDVSSTVRRMTKRDRSLSAIAWCAKTDAKGFFLAHHNVFFSDDYEAEFRDLANGPARDPTVYLCDQGEGRMLILMNAPADGQSPPHDAASPMLERLQRSGLALAWPPKSCMMRGPKEFAELYQATGGALYGRASNGWQATFQRPRAKTKITGLYLAGGSVHPGPGVPMAALSGLLAAQQVLSDRASMKTFRGMAIAGGTSTP
jgi:1-hydroxycarotenoid 3,4-desaturase